METSALIGQAQSSWLIFGAPSQPQLTELKSLNMIQANKRLIGTQNTSGKMLTRRKQNTSQFLIGTEMRPFGVLCRPERSRGNLAMRNCLTTDLPRGTTGHSSLACPERSRRVTAFSLARRSLWRRRALARRSLWRRRLIEFLWEIRTLCNPHKTNPRSHF